MSFVRRHKFLLLGILVVVILVFVALPAILGAALRGTVEKKIGEAANAPARLASLSVSILPPGATLSGLEIGNPDPAAANHPLLTIASAKARVTLGTVLGRDTHVTSLTLSGLTLYAAVNAQGESSFTRFLRHMTPSTRTTELPIDAVVLQDVRVAAYLDPSLMHSEHAAGDPDGTTTIAQVRASDFILAPPGGFLSREVWARAEVEGAVCTAPTLNAPAAPAGSVPEGVAVKGLTVELAQATSATEPVRIRRIELDGLEYGVAYYRKGLAPAAERAIQVLAYAMGTHDPQTGTEPPGPATATAGLLVQSLAIRNGRMEVRGPDCTGRPAFWRLKDLHAEGENLASAANVKIPAPGFLKVQSESESSSGPGNLTLEAKNITGGYPKSSFDVHYKVEGLAATPFSISSQEANGPGIQSGHIGVLFDGPCREGNLQVDGSLTLSKDFEVDTQAAHLVASVARGKPIETIRVRGTMDHPELSWPSALAGVIGNAMEKILGHGTISALSTTGAFTGAAAHQGTREADKAVKSLSKMFGGGK